MIKICCAHTTIEKIENLKLNSQNTNKHPKDQVDVIVHSLKKYGWRRPILVGSFTGTVVAGEGRYLAAKKLGLKEVPIDYQEFDSELEEYKYLEADNNTTKNSEWDEDKFKINLGKFDIDFKDFKKEDFGLLNFDLPCDVEDGNTKEDEVPEVAKNEFGVKLGDVWQLGEHRLMCGDSTNTEEVERLMDGEKADMVFTDPPYGVNYVNRRKPWGGIKNDKLEDTQLVNFLMGSDYTAGTKYICCNWQSIVWFLAAYGKPNNLIVWDKKCIGLGQGYRPQYELILFFGKISHNSESNVWSIARDVPRDYQHQAQKPISVIVRAIINSDPKIVYDSFLGSGSTLIACEKTKRKCYGMELDEHYCSVIIKRWEDYTGNRAILKT